ncbi:hypothetical protein [Singulisphaera acidiphila]|uniref:Uncharacterized protein n=1 Tax=Singulisphaera acidiphila (strain ATCC BAA-1392 / DSM 18658 / VKM B-2454 / MOB10) TaxID=886293 RepID=L0DH03_SINAD|nr:hypothetical protein [Singulisphaera acidiphila]AGA28542.1 hypothetical protein Sinac_4345 [Singulisphaera acidiphila DSM 18658]
MKPPPMTTRQMILLVAIAAVMLGGPQVIERLHQDGESRAITHNLMAYFCGNEASLFSERATTCRSLASKGIPWNQEGEERETLRLCPHQIQEPEHGSWTEQSAGWERAAKIAGWASTRHWWTAGLYNLWGGWPTVAPFSLITLLVFSWFFLGRLDRSSTGESTRRGSKIALLLLVLCLLPWVLQDWGCLSLFLEARE